MSISVELVGKPELDQRLNADKAKQRLREGLTRAAIDIQGYVVRSKLSGQILNNVTGTLRRSINYRVEEDDNGNLEAFVGAFAGYVNPKGKEYAASYARVNEYGGTFNIPAHERTVTSVFGRQLDSPVVQQVKAHTATYPERSFLRSGLKDRKAQTLKYLKQGANEALK